MLKKITFSILIIVTIAISWTGILDQRSEQYLDEALISGGVIYATARGINAAVSVIQGTELDAAIATFTVGEVLDPLNDLIERFSAILLVALGSLAIQKILLEILSSAEFTYLVLGIGTAALVSLWASRFQPVKSILIRTFIITALARFTLTLAVLASSLVDQTFLEQKDEARHANMQLLRDSVHRLSIGKQESPKPEVIITANKELAAATRENTELNRELQSFKTELTLTEAELEVAFSELTTGCKYNPLCTKSKKVVDIEQRIADISKEIGRKEAELEIAQRNQKDRRENLQCLQKEQRGETCDSWSISPSSMKARIDNLADKLTDFASNAIELLMSLLIKTLLIPLAFIWSFSVTARRSIERLSP